MYPYLALLHQAEYHQLLRKGQLQALPTNRFLDATTEPQLATWLSNYTAPLAEATAWLLLPTRSNIVPLAIEQTAFDAPIPLEPTAAEQFLVQQPVTVSRSWFDKLREVIRSIAWLQKNAPYGIVIVARYGGGRPEQQPVLEIAPHHFLRPEDMAEPSKWQQALPDITDDDGAVILTLRQPFAYPLLKSHHAGEAIALTERGRFLLIEQSRYPSTLGFTYQKYVLPVLAARQAVDQQATASRVSDLVPLKPADRKKLGELQTQLLDALTRKYQHNPEITLTTFWDALLAYERTGEGAEAISTTSRGYLMDIGSTVKRYLSAQKARGEFDDATNAHIRVLLGQWGEVMHDSSLDNNADVVFAPKHPANVLVQHFNQLLRIVGPNVLGTSYLYFYLRDTIGNKEQDLTADMLQQLIASAKSIKLECELSLALYAIGLLEPNHRFLPALRTSPAVTIPITSKSASTVQATEELGFTAPKNTRAPTPKPTNNKPRSNSKSKKSNASEVIGSLEFSSNDDSASPASESPNDSVNLASITQ